MPIIWKRSLTNVLPTQADDDYLRKQYFQQPNQIKVNMELRDFYDEHGGSNTVFGVLTGYPCCVSNMHQGWPKLVQNLFYATAGNGIAALVYGPASAKVNVADGVKVNITEETNYPFEGEIHFRLMPEKNVDFGLQLRVPGWCEAPEVFVNERKNTNENQK